MSCWVVKTKTAKNELSKMASDDIECITLDDSDDEGTSPSVLQYHHHHHQAVAGGIHAGRPLVGRAKTRHEPQMVRCNLCVDPGLLPVETDRAKHR